MQYINMQVTFAPVIASEPRHVVETIYFRGAKVAKRDEASGGKFCVTGIFRNRGGRERVFRISI